MDPEFGFLVTKNRYARDIRPPSCILRAFHAVFRDFVTANAHAHKQHWIYFRFQNGPKFGFFVPKNICTREIRPSNCILRAFDAVLRDLFTPLDLLPVSKWTSNFDLSCRINIHTREIRAFSPFFVILLLRMRRNVIKSTSGFKSDLRFGFLVPKNHIHIHMEIRPSICILRTETTLNLLPVSKWTESSDFSCQKHI